MNFKEARKLLEKGKRIKRESWRNKDFSLPISLEEQEEGYPYLTIEDIDADDWIIYKKKIYCKECGRELWQKKMRF